MTTYTMSADFFSINARNEIINSGVTTIEVVASDDYLASYTENEFEEGLLRTISGQQYLTRLSGERLTLDPEVNFGTITFQNGTTWDSAALLLPDNFDGVNEPESVSAYFIYLGGTRVDVPDTTAELDRFVDAITSERNITSGPFALGSTFSFEDVPGVTITENDLVAGTSAADTIDLGIGDDSIFGNDGDDSLIGGAGDDRIFGGNQSDTISAGVGNDRVFGGNGRDTVFLNQGDDIFFDNGQGGSLGVDVVFAGLGNDTIQGGNGNDIFRGEDGNDVIFGRKGDDSIFGGNGFDTISAGEGNDIVTGGNGRDVVFLNQGDDTYLDNGQGGFLGEDRVFAGLGNDTIQGGNGNDTFFGEAGNDRIFGRKGDDQIFAGDQFDFVDAGDGNDVVFAGNGRDTVNLGAGNDRYVDTAQAGALGRDVITGGTGADTFVFGAVMSADIITDFGTGADQLQLAQATWTGTLTEEQVVEQFADVVGSNVVFDFGNGRTITLQGVTETTGLADDLILV